jgi:hypothetical protein
MQRIEAPALPATATPQLVCLSRQSSTLPKQSPTLPIEGLTPNSVQRFPKAIEVYWQP